MKKDFLNVTPDSGGGDTQVNVTADANPSSKQRSTTLNFAASGGEPLQSVTAVQAGSFRSAGSVGMIIQNRSTLSGPMSLMPMLYPISMGFSSKDKVSVPPYAMYSMKIPNLGSSTATDYRFVFYIAVDTEWYSQFNVLQVIAVFYANIAGGAMNQEETKPITMKPNNEGITEGSVNFSNICYNVNGMRTPVSCQIQMIYNDGSSPKSFMLWEFGFQNQY